MSRWISGVYTADMQRGSALVVVLLAASIGVGFACGSPAPATGQGCMVVEDCYPGVDPALLPGVDCVEKFPGGFCTHTCEVDEDCCAVEGECADGLVYVCSPYENDKTKRCFLGCGAEVLGDVDGAAHCSNYVSPAYVCSSSGGGPENREVCRPPG